MRSSKPVSIFQHFRIPTITEFRSTTTFHQFRYLHNHSEILLGSTVQSITLEKLNELSQITKCTVEKSRLGKALKLHADSHEQLSMAQGRFLLPNMYFFSYGDCTH